MAKKLLPTVEHLRKRLDYDPVSGLLTYKRITARDIPGSAANSAAVRADDFNRNWAGQLAYKDDRRWNGGSRTPQIRFDGVCFSAHRVAWAIHYGEWPEDGAHIDHINGDPWDNRIENLRLATPSQNGANQKSRQGCVSQYKGVTHLHGKWAANITKNGKRKYLGSFNDQESAAIAYDCAAIAIWREFARPNIIENPYLTSVAK